MKQIYIFLLLLSLNFSLAILMDLIQGLSMYETIHAIIKFKQKMTGEEIVLIILFFLPLIFTKVDSINKNNNHV
jgi:hypothetical protein